MTEKEWVTVTFHGTGQRWIPSFADLHRIIVAIAEVEETKYPSAQGMRGGAAVYDFLHASQRSFSTGQSYDSLAAQYRIPTERPSAQTSVEKFAIEIGTITFPSWAERERKAYSL